MVLSMQSGLKTWIPCSMITKNFVWPVVKLSSWLPGWQWCSRSKISPMPLPLLYLVVVWSFWKQNNLDGSLLSRPLLPTFLKNYKNKANLSSIRVSIFSTVPWLGQENTVNSLSINPKWPLSIPIFSLWKLILNAMLKKMLKFQNKLTIFLPINVFSVVFGQ